MKPRAMGQSGATAEQTTTPARRLNATTAGAAAGTAAAISATPTVAPAPVAAATLPPAAWRGLAGELLGARL
jgi:hypothetical protein